MPATTLPIVTYFSEVEDPRVVGRTKHRLIDIIVMTICAHVAGAEGWEDIAVRMGSVRMGSEWGLVLHNA